MTSGTRAAITKPASTEIPWSRPTSGVLSSTTTSTELATVKSTLNYFMQAYWKRSSKASSKIELATALKHDYGVQQQSLCLVARQKNSIHSLEISLIENGKTANNIYLSGQEVIMLDIAIGKAINLLTPTCQLMVGHV